MLRIGKLGAGQVPETGECIPVETDERRRVKFPVHEADPLARVVEARCFTGLDSCEDDPGAGGHIRSGLLMVEVKSKFAA